MVQTEQGHEYTLVALMHMFRKNLCSIGFYSLWMNITFSKTSRYRQVFTTIDQSLSRILIMSTKPPGYFLRNLQKGDENNHCF